MLENPNNKRVMCIAGPTASGKSAHAIALAKKHGGEIVNADSMQVYSDLQIVSARPSQAEMDGIPHHLFGHIDGCERYSTGTWVREIMPVIGAIRARGNVPIVVGGTGLYFRALTIGLAAVPPPSAAALKEAQGLLDSGIKRLRDRAEALDPVASARVLGDDPQRLLRIVSVAMGTDKLLSVWQEETHPLLARDEWTGTVLLPERQALYDRINARFDTMMQDGGLEEIKAVAKRGLAPDLPMMKAIGLPPLLAHLKGEISYEEALSLAKRDTRRFAKRQFTWFRGNSEGWNCAKI